MLIQRTHETTFAYKQLELGIALFHGTQSADDFDVPDGPAWFCQSLDGASHWCRPIDQLFTKRDQGATRVKQYRTMRALRLADMSCWQNHKQWRSLSEKHAGMLQFAKVIELYAEGWYMNDEVMLCRPCEVVKYCQEALEQ